MRLNFILLLLIFVYSCNDDYSLDGLSIFRYNESTTLSSLDPAFAKDKATIWATSQLFNGLVKMDNQSRIVPSIAEDWDISSDGKSYRFYIRDDIYFHDHNLFEHGKGRKVVAADFTYSFDRILDHNVASPGSWIFNNVESYYAVNDTTFEIVLRSPFAPFLGILSMQYCSVVPKEIVEAGNFRRDPIGTGPFQFQYWKEDVKLVFRKNPNYFEKEDTFSLPYLDAVSITFVKDAQANFLNFLNGEIDFISGIDASYKDEVLNIDGELSEKYVGRINMEVYPYLNTEYLGFLVDTNTQIARSLSLRKAINYGFDRKKMLRYLRNNIGSPAVNGFVPYGMPFFNDSLIGYMYDPLYAKELVQKSVRELGEDIHPITLSTTSEYLDICEFIQSQLSDLGIDINVQVFPSSTLRKMISQSKIMFFRASWIADYPDAENYFSLFYSKNWSPNGPNYTHFSNKEFDRLYEMSIKNIDKETRKDLYLKMDNMIINNALVVPLYYDRIVRFYQLNIFNLYTNSQNSLDLVRVIKD